MGTQLPIPQDVLDKFIKTLTNVMAPLGWSVTLVEPPPNGCATLRLTLKANNYTFHSSIRPDLVMTSTEDVIQVEVLYVAMTCLNRYVRTMLGAQPHG